MVSVETFARLGELSADTEANIQEFNRLVFGSSLHPGQLRVELEADHQFNLVSPGNSWGKTEHIARGVTRKTWYKKQKGLEYQDVREWLTKDYRSLVASYQFDIAKESWQRLEHLYDQGGTFTAMVKKLIRTDPPRIEFNNGATLDFGTLRDGGRHVEATRRQVIYVDEVGHMEDFKHILGNVLRPRGIGVGGIVIAYGTPKENTDPWLYEVALEAQNGNDHYYFYEASSFENEYWPEQEKQLVLSDPLFVKSSGKLTQLGEQVINGKFILAGGLFFPKLSVMRMFRGTHEFYDCKGRPCMTAWDTAGGKKGGDATVGVTLDLSEKPWRVSRIEYVPAGTASWQDKFNLMEECYQKDKPQYVGVDVTGNNDSIEEELWRRGLPVEPLHFGGANGQKKYDMLRNLQAVMDLEWEREDEDEKKHRGLGLIRFPDEREYLELEDRRKEFERYKLEDKKLTTDTVMATAMAAKLAVDLYLPDPTFGSVY